MTSTSVTAGLPVAAMQRAVSCCGCLSMGALTVKLCCSGTPNVIATYSLLTVRSL